MKHAKTSVSTEIFAGAIISVVQYLTLLWYGGVLMSTSSSTFYIGSLKSSPYILQENTETYSFNQQYVPLLLLVTENAYYPPQKP
jgi:hypothetical protein